MDDHVVEIPNIKVHSSQDYCTYDPNNTPLIFSTEFQIALSKKFLTTE